VRRFAQFLSMLAFSLWAGSALASPTAQDLIRTCEAALAADYNTVDAAMCDWYVAPCGVCGKEGPPQPNWCLPPELTGAALARTVVDALRAAPQLAAAPAPTAVEAVLKARYPCAGKR